MAIPSSGELKLWDTLWNQELGGTKGENSLHSASVYAGFSTPDALSDFYGWSDVELPTVQTNSATSVGSTSLTANGNVTNDGNEAVTRGFYFGTSNNRTSNTKYTLAGTQNEGAFSCGFTGLSFTTTYKMWAWANNSVGQANGSQVNATTTAPPFTPQLATINRITMQWPTQDNSGALSVYSGYLNPYTSGYVVNTQTSGQNTHGHTMTQASQGACNARTRQCARFTGCLGQYMTGNWGLGAQRNFAGRCFVAPFSAQRGGPWGYADQCYQIGVPSGGDCVGVSGDPGRNGSFQRICINNSTGLQSTWNQINNMCLASDIRLKTNISYL